MTDELDIEQPAALIEYLRANSYIAPDEQPHLTTLAGGVSNRTVLVERPGGEAWVLKQALTKLRVAVDWFSDPERIHREALGMRSLARLAPPGTITPLVWQDTARHLLAMQAVPQPHANWKTLLLAGQLDMAHITQFGQLLGTIHRRSWEQRSELAPLFDDRSFFESLRVEPYYAYTTTQVPEAEHFYNALIAETRAQRLALVHGDYSPKNVLVHNGRLVLLDHEVIHFGDPAFDLGFSCTHLLSKAHHLPVMRSAFVDAARLYWDVYRATLDDVPWARDLEPRAVRHTLGCLLARVAGRSPLEYLTTGERQDQRAVVIMLMQHPPTTMEALIQEFIGPISST